MALGSLFGFGRAERRLDSMEEAIAAVAEALPGFHAFDATIGADRCAALTIDTTGRIAVVQICGRKVRARELLWSMLRATPVGILIEMRDRHLDGLLLQGVSAVDVRRLGMPPLMQRERARITAPEWMANIVEPEDA